MAFSEKQKEQLNGISCGFRMNKGTPCECEPDNISTRKEYAFSDSIVYHHTCTACGNKYSTWIEG